MEQTLCIRNGRIYGRQGLSEADTLLIDRGIIRYVGNEAGLQRRLLRDIRIVDAGGRLVFPGFTDTHLHLTEWARRQDYLELGAFRSLKALLNFLREASEKRDWLIGGGWNQNAWEERRFPNCRDLDMLPKGTKAIFYSKDLHSAWVNESVIDLFDFDKVVDMLQKGYVRRDAAGRLDGILHEEALEVLLEPILRRRPVPLFKDPQSWFRPFYRYGITALHSMEHIEDYERYLQMYQHEKNRGPRLGIYIYDSDHGAVFERGMRSATGGEWLQFQGLKIFVDGALGSQTAWLRAPYENAVQHGKRQVHGEELFRAIARAEGHGCGLSVHALGDAAVEDLLNVLERFGRPLKVPLRIEHAQLLDEALIERLREHALPVSVNPSHLIDDKSIAETHWGERSRWAYPLRSLKMAGIPFAFASDAPVEDINPWKGIFAAVHRRGAGENESWYPEECIRLSDAIDACCLNVRALGGISAGKGLLEPGFAGDCFICNRDVFEQGVEDWREIRSLLTVIDGRIVYRSAELG
jgi:predicted amidohydrolase YtcJ